MGKPMATVYEHDDIYDLIAPGPAKGVYHVFALKDRASVDLVSRGAFLIGSMLFIPGMSYGRFGSDEHTSAGFVWYDGEPITFFGTYKDNALFTSKDGPFRYDDQYPVCFWSWRFSVEHSMFIAITTASAGRRMDL